MSESKVGLIVISLSLSTADLAAQQDSTLEKYTETIITENGEELSFEMLPVPGGTFLMGSREDQRGRKEDEGPQHLVDLSPFYLSSTEASLRLFTAYYEETLTEKEDQPEDPQAAAEIDAVSGPTPVYGDIGMGNPLDHPAIGMTWHNAVTFCKWLSKKTGKKYRLPTEAEWEYSCRAGTSNIYAGTDDEDQLENVAWYDENADGSTQSVGKKAPNEWGLYDMSGNVREWVQDFYVAESYSGSNPGSTLEDPVGPVKGRAHVARGGDYSSFPEEIRCSARAYEAADWRALDPQFPKSRWWLPFMDIIGIRVARSAK